MKLNTVNLYPKINPKHLTFTPNILNQFKHANIISPQIIRNASERIEFSYDKHERLSKVQNKSHILEFDYNNMSQLSLQVQDGLKTVWTKEVKLHAEYIHFLNHMLEDRIYTRECDRTLILDNQEPISISYHAREHTQTITYPNGLREHYKFNERSELIHLETADKIFTYERDAVGRIIKLNDMSYTYDAIGRLTRVNNIKFKYDKAGNNKYHQAQYNTKNKQLIENRFFIYSYDKRGNLKYKINKQT